MASNHDRITTAAPFCVLVDDREKGGSDIRTERAFDFAAMMVPHRRAHLAQGDYSLAGYEGRFAIERKSPTDLVSTLFGFHRAGGRKVANVERFADELQRLSGYDRVYVSITGGESDIAAAANAHALEVWSRTGGRYRFPPNAEAVFSLVASLSAEFAIPFVVFPDVASAERQALRDFRAWHRWANGLSHVGSYRRAEGAQKGSRSARSPSPANLPGLARMRSMAVLGALQKGRIDEVENHECTEVLSDAGCSAR